MIVNSSGVSSIAIFAWLIRAMVSIAKTLLKVTQDYRPDLYSAILRKIRPYSLKSVIKILAFHLRNVSDLKVFNDNIEDVPNFVWTVVKHMILPTPGDAVGIHVICRVTKSDTQTTLDSKHLQTITSSLDFEFHVEKDILDELSLFSNHMHLFELGNRHKYATVFMSDDGPSVRELGDILPDAGILLRGKDFNKGLAANGMFQYLRSFRFILVEDRGSIKVLYKSLNDLFLILKRVELKHVVAFSDVRCLFKKCGVTCAFFNMVQVARRQLFANDNSRYESDVITLLTFMFCRGQPLPMNREGLAKTKDRPPIDVLSFEAMKRNSARLATGPSRGQWHKVQSSLESVFTGVQFKEGTGYQFELYGAEMDESEQMDESIHENNL